MAATGEFENRNGATGARELREVRFGRGISPLRARARRGSHADARRTLRARGDARGDVHVDARAGVAPAPGDRPPRGCRASDDGPRARDADHAKNTRRPRRAPSDPASPRTDPIARRAVEPAHHLVAVPSRGRDARPPRARCASRATPPPRIGSRVSDKTQRPLRSLFPRRRSRADPSPSPRPRPPFPQPLPAAPPSSSPPPLPTRTVPVSSASWVSRTDASPSPSSAPSS